MGCQVSANCLQHQQRKYKFSARLLHSTVDTQNNPENSPNQSCKSTFSDFENRLERSIASYQQFLQANADLRYPFDGLGNIQDQVGYFQTKIESWYESSRENGTLNGNPFDALSLCYSLKKDVSEGKQWYEDMIAKHPLNQYLHFGLGNIYYKLEMYDDAQKCYRKSIDINPRLDKAYQSIANIYCFKKFDNSQAEEWSKFALKLNPRNEYALLINAVVNDNVSHQIHQLQKMLQTHTSYARVYNALGHAYMEKNKYKTAIKWFLDGYAKNQYYYAIPCGLALASNKIGKFDDAIQWGKKSMSLNPLHHQPYLSLGDAYKGKGQLEEAKQWYLKGIEVKPQFNEAYLKLAYLYSLQDEDKAIKYFEIYLSKNSDNQEALFDIAKLHIKRRQTHIAVNYLLSIYDLSTHQQALFLLAQSLHELKNNDESEQFFYKYIKNSSNKQQAKRRVAKAFNAYGKTDRMAAIEERLRQL